MAFDSSATTPPSRVAAWNPVLAIGGLDSSGGAGLVRDFLTAEALGACAHMVATAWTLQASGTVTVETRAPVAVGADVRQALATVAPHAVKIGMVGSAGVAEALAEALAEFTGPVVFDPVLATSSGHSLFAGALSAVKTLSKIATLVTPNLDEAARLSGVATTDTAAILASARALIDAGARAVLVKGGHGQGDEAADVLMTASGAVHRFSAPRVPGPSPRGTGCALATAIAIGLGRGADPRAAVATAKAWLHTRIKNARARGEQRFL